jgi:phosphoserine phosphatase RsbU/P
VRTGGHGNHARPPPHVRANLSKRLTLWIGAPATLLFAGVFWIASHRSYEHVAKQAEQVARSLANFHAAELDRTLSRAAKIPESLALAVESGAFRTEESLEELLREAVRRNPEIYGSALAFESRSFTPDRHFYAPYFYRKDDRVTFVQLGNAEYDYFRWDWYRLPKAAGKALWSEPYFDDGGGDAVMTTYSVPLWRDGAFWGIATIDIALSQLTAAAERIKVGSTGYAFIISKQGRILAFPQKEQVMRGTIQDASAELARHMMSGEQGFLRTAEPATGSQAWIAYVPIQMGDLSLAVVYPEGEVLADARRLQGELLALGVAGLVAVYFALYLVARSISRPITDLALAARRVAEGEMNHRVETNQRTDEVRELAGAFNKMTRELRMRMEELRYTTRIQERLEGELSAARNIQMSLLPKKFPAFPDREELDIHAVVKPARAVGGDFYDFFFIDRDRLCLMIGDVAGKGVPAALFMAVSMTLLKMSLTAAHTPAEIMARVSDKLFEEAGSGMFVSLVCVLLNVRTGEMEVCNAGHPAPLLLSSSGAVSHVNGSSGVALGAWSNLTYEPTHRRLAPGDMLVLFTDGVTEAFDRKRCLYSVKRLEEKLAHFTGKRAEYITRGIVQDIRSYCAGSEQSDDITLLAVRWYGPAASNLGVEENRHVA